MNELTTRERITILLEFFRDVEDGLNDYSLRDDNSPPIFGMGPAWNHPSYKRLRELIPKLASERPRIHWDLAEMYLRWRPNMARRVAYCPQCKNQYPASQIGTSHKHGQKHVDLMPRIARNPSKAIREENVKAGIAWLADRWEADVFIPDAIMDILDKTRLGKAA